jgi:hypothetical protein
MLLMPPTGRWILIVAALASVAIALVAITMYPLNTKDPTIIFLYEISVFIGMFIVLGLAYKRGYTEREDSS